VAEYWRLSESGEITWRFGVYTSIFSEEVSLTFIRPFHCFHCCFMLFFSIFWRILYSRSM